MSITTTKLDSSQLASETAVYLFDDWFDPIEAGVRDRVREFIQAMVEGELGSALMRPRYGRRPKSLSDAPAAGVTGHRIGSRSRFHAPGSMARMVRGPNGRARHYEPISAAPLQLTH